MSKISYSDLIYVTVISRGRIIMNTTVSGFDSASSLLRHLGDRLRAYAGQLLELRVRNYTGGWSHTDRLLFAA